MADFKPQDLSQLDKDRFSSYSGNLAFYGGTQWAKTSKNRQLVFNYSKIAIDKITSYLMNGLNYSFEPLAVNGISAGKPPAANGKVDIGKQASISSSLICRPFDTVFYWPLSFILLFCSVMYTTACLINRRAILSVKLQLSMAYY